MADQVRLRVVARCDCGEYFCPSFYTEPPPEGAYRSPDPANRDLREFGLDGMLILDVVDERIQFVNLIVRLLRGLDRDSR